MKQYLGDSVYCEFDGCEIILTTENGLPDDPSNQIVLDLGIYQSLLLFMKQFKEAR